MSMEANKKTDNDIEKVAAHFNAAAAQWNTSSQMQERSEALYHAIMRCTTLHTQMSVADYGCATGTLSLKLYPHVKSIDAFDLAPLMIDELKKQIEGKNFYNLHPIVLNLLYDNFPASPKYDVIVSAMTLHHVQDVPALIKKLSLTLKPKGTLLLADLDSEDGSFHKSDSQGVYHQGFERANITQWMEQAGCQNISIETFYNIIKEEKTYPLFLAKGIKEVSHE